MKLSKVKGSVLVVLASLTAIPAFAQTTTPPTSKIFICTAVQSKYAKAETLIIKKITDKLTAAPLSIPAADIKVKLKKLPDTNVEQITVNPTQASVNMSVTLTTNPLAIANLNGELDLDQLDSCSLTKNYKGMVTIKGTPAQTVHIQNISIEVQGRFKEKKI